MRLGRQHLPCLIMAYSYKRMVDVIQKPSSEREVTELALCESWFRKKSKLLKILKQGKQN